MSQLRPTSEPELQIIIDKILENMLTLPDVGEMQHKAECIYHKHLPSKDDVSSRSDAKSSEQKDTRIHHEHITQTQNRPTYDIEEPQVGYFVHQSHQQSINELSANQQLQLQTSQGPGWKKKEFR
uniref:Uncharacterized protein LOC102807054 n=1 Tax=Saccoglossus kowalevskii TaxID=10224 RepID=A0ABM0M3N2_SACKO|nr:PREDICTED: uncharacterized protein LOC102807054 [Saccoglossus kowalevskii]